VFGALGLVSGVLVLGFGIAVFGLRVRVLDCWVCGFGCWVCGFGFWVCGWVFGAGVSGEVFDDLGFGFVSCVWRVVALGGLGFGLLWFGFCVLGLWFGCWCLGCGCSGLVIGLRNICVFVFGCVRCEVLHVRFVAGVFGCVVWGLELGVLGFGIWNLWFGAWC